MDKGKASKLPGHTYQNISVVGSNANVYLRDHYQVSKLLASQTIIRLDRIMLIW